MTSAALVTGSTLPSSIVGSEKPKSSSACSDDRLYHDAAAGFSIVSPLADAASFAVQARTANRIGQLGEHLCMKPDTKPLNDHCASWSSLRSFWARKWLRSSASSVDVAATAGPVLHMSGNGAAAFLVRLRRRGIHSFGPSGCWLVEDVEPSLSEMEYPVRETGVPGRKLSNSDGRVVGCCMPSRGLKSRPSSGSSDGKSKPPHIPLNWRGSRLGSVVGTDDGGVIWRAGESGV